MKNADFELPEYTYITTGEPADIIENFSYDRPSEAVYKITGIRGSGKTVILAYVQEKMQSQRFQDAGGLVYTLNPTRDMLQQLSAYLYKEKYIKDSIKSSSIGLTASVLENGGGITYYREMGRNVRGGQISG